MEVIRKYDLKYRDNANYLPLICILQTSHRLFPQSKIRTEVSCVFRIANGAISAILRTLRPGPNVELHTSRIPNLMQITKNNRFYSFALGSTREVRRLARALMLASPMRLLLQF